MEKKLKFSEFAELIGVTPKTVYKMELRNEIKTSTEKVNNREMRIVITTDEQIEHFRLLNSNKPNINSNCEDILTDLNSNMNSNNYSQINNNSFSVAEIFDRIVEINQQYNEEIKTLNEELLRSKSQVLLLEDKAGREGMYIKEINELKRENERVRTSKKTVINVLVTVIVGLLLLLTVIITVNVVTNNGDVSLAEKKEPAQQEVTQPATQARR